MIDYKLKYEIIRPQWLIRLRPTQQIRHFHNGYVLGIKNAFVAGRQSGSMKRASLSRTKPLISKAVVKKVPVLNLLTWIRFVVVAIFTSVVSQTNIIYGKLNKRGRKLLTKLSSNLASIRRKIGNPNYSIGKPNSKKISMSDTFYAYSALLMISGGFLYYARSLWAIGIVFLATYVIVKRFN